MKASFRVEIAGPAESDLRAIHDHIAQDKPQAAGKWLSRMLKDAGSMETIE
jgi:plasmid stabilization system protein ParE